MDQVLGLVPEGLRVTPAELALASLATLLIGAVVRDAWAWYRLRHIPGPVICGFSTLWLVQKFLSGRANEDFKRLAEKYGPLVRIGPNEIFSSNMEVLHRVGAPRSGYRKSDWYMASQMDPKHENLVSMRDNDLRAERRKKMFAGMSGRSSDGFESSMDKTIAAFVDLIERKYVSTDSDFRPMELATRTQFFALDCVGEMAFSSPLGFLATDTDMHDIIKINDAAFPIMTIFGLYSWVLKLLFSWPFNNLLPKDGDKAGWGAIISFSSSLIHQRLHPDAKPKRDIVQSFIDHGMTEIELKQEVTSLIVAGSDTSAGAIRMTLLYLMTNPAVYRKLLAELSGAIAQGLVSSPVKDAEAQALPYLQAAIREGLRVFPPVAAAPFYKVVPREGDMIDGYYVPGGTNISTHAAIYAMCRSKAFWGDDADMFRPERWLEVDELRYQSMVHMEELVFSHGQFQCMGKGAAFMELNKLLPELLRRYDFAPVDPTQPVKLFSAAVWLAHEYWVKITRREPLTGP